MIITAIKLLYYFPSLLVQSIEHINYIYVGDVRYLQDPIMRQLVDNHVATLRANGYDRMYPWGQDEATSSHLTLPEEKVTECWAMYMYIIVFVEPCWLCG